MLHLLGEIKSQCGKAVHVPEAYALRILKNVMKTTKGDIDSQGELQSLVDILGRESMPYSILFDATNRDMVSAITFHDAIIAPSARNRCAVYTMDVTFGITNNNSGFSKWCFFSSIISGRHGTEK